jgi:hypothetical protein
MSLDSAPDFTKSKRVAPDYPDSPEYQRKSEESGAGMFAIFSSFPAGGPLGRGKNCIKKYGGGTGGAGFIVVSFI